MNVDYCSEQPPTLNPGTPPIISFRLVFIVAAALLVLDVVVTYLVADSGLRLVFSDLIIPLTNLLAVALLYLAGRQAARTYGTPFGRPWFWWMAAFISYAIAGVIWAIYELYLGEPPYPSWADVFYLAFYPLIWWGLAKYPTHETRAHERRLIFLDNVIVVLGAGLSFWVFLVQPFLATFDYSLETFLDLTYPTLGMVTLWTILVFFRSRLEQSAYPPLLMMGVGVLLEITADLVFAYHSLNDTFVSGNWGDILYLGCSLAFMLAAAWHLQRQAAPEASDHALQTTDLSSPNRWPVYLPYFWLVVAYILLIQSLPDHYTDLPFFVIIGIVIALVVLRQILTLNENRRLYISAQNELRERQQAQEALRQTNAVLDARVGERTQALQEANDQLLAYNQRVAASLQEKEVLLKEIHHRVKNNLQIVSSLLSLQTRLVPDPVGAAALLDSQMRVRAMALIHEKLYQSDNLAEIKLRTYIDSLTTMLVRSYQVNASRVRLMSHIDEVAVGIDMAVPLGLIVNELVANAFKHAFPEAQEGVITVGLHRLDPDRLSLTVADDGCGLPPGMDIRMSKSLGLQLVHNLTHQLNGEVTFNGPPGVTVTLTLPAPVAAANPTP